MRHNQDDIQNHLDNRDDSETLELVLNFVDGALVACRLEAFRIDQFLGVFQRLGQIGQTNDDEADQEGDRLAQDQSFGDPFVSTDVNLGVVVGMDPFHLNEGPDQQTNNSDRRHN